MFNAMYASLLCAALSLKGKVMSFAEEEKGAINLIEIVVLIGIVIILAIAFRGAIVGLLTDLFTTIKGGAASATGGSVTFG